MKKWILSIVVCATITLPAMAQQVEGNNQLLSSGDLYQGISRSIPNGRVVLPYGLEVTFEKTVHLIFPAAIRYVDLGSQNIIAGKADDAENVLRVKAAVREFETETNMSVMPNFCLKALLSSRMLLPIFWVFEAISEFISFSRVCFSSLSPTPLRCLMSLKRLYRVVFSRSSPCVSCFFVIMFITPAIASEP